MGCVAYACVCLGALAPGAGACPGPGLLATDLIVLGLSWAATLWLLARRLPLQNLAALALGAIGISAVAHVVAIRGADLAPFAVWQAPFTMGVVILAARELGRLIVLGPVPAVNHHRGFWILGAAVVASVPLLFGLALFIGCGQAKLGFVIGAWILASGIAQVLLTPWWIQKKPVQQTCSKGVAWLCLGMSLYLLARLFMQNALAPIPGTLLMVAVAAAVAGLVAKPRGPGAA